MVLILISSVLFGLYIFSLFKYFQWFFYHKDINIKAWFLISLLLITIGSYTILMFIVNSIDFSGSTVSFILSRQTNVLLYIYLSLMFASTLVEGIKLSKMNLNSNDNYITKYFLGFSFIKFSSLILFISYITILTI